MNPERKLALTLAQECAIAEACTDTEEVVARAEKYLAFLSRPPLPGYYATWTPPSGSFAQQPLGTPAAPGHDPKRWPR